ncbi:NAD(P)-binding oxidoreductase [Aspergillus foveolatus]|uniref:NAD(P)-binding oxidoreductase n=1 Tax=Aspergillus foveolatus TaxID=210207 RepID=UPI003CCD3B61
MSTITTYAFLGSTGNCGRAIIQILLRRPDAQIRAYCRSRAKLVRLLPEMDEYKQVEVFEGSIHDEQVLAACIRNCRAVFLVVSTTITLPAVVWRKTPPAPSSGLCKIKQAPKLILLSSATIDDHFSRHVPFLLRQILLRSAPYVYHDLLETEKLLRAEIHWLTTIFIKPGALSVDEQRGHALSLTDETSPLSYLDLAAVMVEAVDDPDGRYDMRDVSVVNTNGPAKFSTGSPVCLYSDGACDAFLPISPSVPAIYRSRVIT